MIDFKSGIPFVAIAIAAMLYVNSKSLTLFLVLGWSFIGCGAPKNSFARRNATKEDAKKLRQIGVTLHNYNDTYKCFPFDPTLKPERNPDLSWRVSALAQFKQHTDLFDKFDLKSSPSSNGHLIEEGKDIFCLSNGSLVSAIKTDRFIRRLADIHDGTSFTIILLENPNLKAEDWTKSNDLSVDEAIKLLRKVTRGDYLQAMLADGTTMQIGYVDPEKISDDELRSLFDHRDGKETSHVFEALQK